MSVPHGKASAAAASVRKKTGSAQGRLKRVGGKPTMSVPHGKASAAAASVRKKTGSAQDRLKRVGGRANDERTTRKSLRGSGERQEIN
jgi:uncharacterized protein YjbJ (UPF0337 family)